MTKNKVIRHAVHPLHRIYIVDNIKLNGKTLKVQFYNYHLLAKNKSLEGKTGACIYNTGKFTMA